MPGATFESNTKKTNDSSASSLFYLPKMRRSRATFEKEDDDDDDDQDESRMLPTNESYWSNKLSAANKKVEPATIAAEKSCETHSIDIDFDDMGFTSWLLEPRRFGTNYCAGKCSFLPINRVRQALKTEMCLKLIFFSIRAKTSSKTFHFKENLRGN